MTYTIKPYNIEHKQVWNKFISTCKNSTFLFHRDFMDYHSDRFSDFSLMVYKKDKLIALLPANEQDQTIYTHQGLSYGGLLYSADLKLQAVIEIIYCILQFLESKQFQFFYWKQLPSIYPSAPNSEMDYLMFILKAELHRRDVLSVIDLTQPYTIASNRMEGVKRAKKNQLKIEEVSDFSVFWNNVLIPNLERRHNARPIHNLEEISYLKRRFPKQIRQFNVIDDEQVIAGTTIFETEGVAHVQYISADEDRNSSGSLDFLFEHLITQVFKDKLFFDFGISNENDGLNINKGLVYWKEGFGARSVTQDHYKGIIKNYPLLKKILF